MGTHHSVPLHEPITTQSFCRQKQDIHFCPPQVPLALWASQYEPIHVILQTLNHRPLIIILQLCLPIAVINIRFSPILTRSHFSSQCSCRKQRGYDNSQFSYIIFAQRFSSSVSASIPLLVLSISPTLSSCIEGSTWKPLTEITALLEATYIYIYIYHRIKGQLRLKGTLKIILFQDIYIYIYMQL